MGSVNVEGVIDIGYHINDVSSFFFFFNDVSHFLY